MATIVKANIANALHSLTGILGTADQIYDTAGEKTVLDLIDKAKQEAQGDIPTKVSQLTNDAKYQTDTQVAATVKTAKDAVEAQLIKSFTGSQQTTSSAYKVDAKDSKNAVLTSFDIPYATSANAGLVCNKDAKTTANSAAETYTTKYINSIETSLTNSISTANTNISSLQTAVNGVNDKLKDKADLDSDGKVPASQLPSYVDDVLEYDKMSSFPAAESAEKGKIYVALDTNKTYRWSGTAYVEISASLALGETSSTAYAGNKGKANAEDIATLQTKVLNSFATTESTSALQVTAQHGTTKLADFPIPYADGTNKGLVLTHSAMQGKYYTAYDVYNTEYVDKTVKSIGSDISGLTTRVTSVESGKGDTLGYDSTTHSVKLISGSTSLSSAAISTASPSVYGVALIFNTKDSSSSSASGAYTANYINSLQTTLENKIADLGEYATATVSVSPTVVYAGERQNINFTVNFKTTNNIELNTSTSKVTLDGTNGTLTKGSITDDGITYTGSYTSKTLAAGSYAVTLNGAYTSHTLSKTITAKTTITAVNAIYYGFASTPSATSDMFKASASTSPKSTYTATSSTASQHFYILVPASRDNLTVDRFSMGGAPVAMTKGTQQTINDVAYSIYYTTASYASGTKLTITAY